MSNQSSENPSAARERVIVRTSIIGILTNVVLAGFKAAVGLIANSIAVVLDAVNNLSDALSSVITIVGTKLAGKAPNKKHPYGYGRIEYMSQLIVAGIVLYAGITALVESIKKIIEPETADYSAVTLIVISAAIVVKLFLGLYVKKTGKSVNSGALVASGSDALFDAILSASVLLSAIISLTTGVSLEAYVGVIIAGFIIKAGIEMISEAVSELLGARVSGEISTTIKRSIAEIEGVHGVYDLLLNNYGPDQLVGSVHVEVDDIMTVSQLDTLTRQIQGKIYKETGVVITTVGVYATNTSDDWVLAVKTAVTKIVMEHEKILQMHGFYMDTTRKTISFDIIPDFSTPDRHALRDEILCEIQKSYPDYIININLDSDFSD